MYFLIYASTAQKSFSEEELVSLLAQARGVNNDLGVTGLLLYAPGTGGAKGTFVQILEGARADVHSVYVKILRDPRHSQCTLLQEGEVFSRRFADWTMGFRDLGTLKPSEVPGFNPIFLKNLTLTQVLAEPDPVVRLLYSFAGT